MEEEEESTGIQVEEEVKLDEPPLYAVLLHNDDYTTMEFVIEVLRIHFGKSTEEAEKIMLDVHKKGRGVAGIYPHEIAETKVSQVTERARSKGFPLRCTLEVV